MPAYQAGSARVSSTVTKRNPRPRKYASASERQAAYRDRAPEVCFRAEAKTVETLDRIAAKNDRSRAELLLSMTKFALANHDWARFGLTHKPLPYGYGLAEQEFVGPRMSNPNKPIWERTRPKSLGKPVPLTPKQKTAAKKRAAAAGRPYPNLVDNIAAARLENPTVKKLPVLSFDGDVVGYAGVNAHKQAMALSGGESIRQEFKVVDGIKRLVWVPIKRKENPTMKKPTPAQLAARARFAEMARSGAFKRKAKRKTNPATKGTTFYVHANLGYGQSQQFKVTTSPGANSARSAANQVAKHLGYPVFVSSRNERPTSEGLPVVRYEFIDDAQTKAVDLFVYPVKREGLKYATIKTNPAKKTVSQKISQLVREGYPQKQAVAVALSEQRAGKVKATPRKRKANPMPNRVTETIYQQLGGNRFAMMTGAKNFVAYPDLLEFSIPRNASSANRVRVFYEPGSDLYTLTFNRTSGLKSSEIARFDDVYADQLQPLFTQVTGLYTSLGTMGRKTNPATGRKESRTKLNPIGSSRVKYVCIAPMEYSGAKYGIDERTPVTMKFTKTEPAAHLVYACYKLPDAVVMSDDFQNFAYHNKIIYVSLAELKKMLRQYL